MENVKRQNITKRYPFHFPNSHLNYFSHRTRKNHHLDCPSSRRKIRVVTRKSQATRNSKQSNVTTIIKRGVAGMDMIASISMMRTLI
jgi:hypothetical protein